MTDYTTLETRAGLVLNIRRAAESDEPALAAFFERVSEDDRRFRFLSAADHIGHDQIDPLVHTDHFRSESFVAFEHRTGDLVASGLVACDNALDTCEVAISVRGDYRGKGIGWAMLDLLAGEARRRGVRRVIAIEDRDNRAAIELERESGFSPEPLDGDPALVVLSKTLR